MGGVPDNGAGVESVHTWGGETANRQTTAEREGWEVVFYPSLEGAMKEAGLTNVCTSINRRQNTVAQFISTRPLLDLCKGGKQREGARVTLRWWEQKGIDWEKAKTRKVQTESASDLGTDMEGKEARETESRASGSSGAEWSGVSADEWEVRLTR